MKIDPNTRLAPTELLYAYGEKSDGTGNVLIVGVTDLAVRTLLTGRRSITVDTPVAFSNVRNVVIFAEPTKEVLRERFQQMASTLGIPIDTQKV